MCDHTKMLSLFRTRFGGRPIERIKYILTKWWDQFVGDFKHIVDDVQFDYRLTTYQMIEYGGVHLIHDHSTQN